MGLEKRTSIDKIEFVGAARSLQIRDLVEVLDNGVVISRSSVRRVLSPCVRDGEAWVPNGLPEESEYIRGIAEAAWDDDARAAYLAAVDARSPVGVVDA